MLQLLTEDFFHIDLDDEPFVISQVGPKYREDSSCLPWLCQDAVDTNRLIVESVGIPGFALVPGVTTNRGTTHRNTYKYNKNMSN